MSDEKKLPAPASPKKAVQLHDSGLRAGSLIEQAVAGLNERQAQNLMEKASEEALRLEVKRHEQNMEYQIGKKVAEDHIETFEMLNKDGRTNRQKVISEIKTGAGKMHIESKSGASCFVATVAYNDPNHPDVIFLRGFRDNVLRNSRIGRSFIAWYWRNGPRLAKFIGRSAFLRRAARAFIAAIVKYLN